LQYPSFSYPYNHSGSIPVHSPPLSAESFRAIEYISAIIRRMDPDNSGKEVVHEIANPLSQHNVPPRHIHDASDATYTRPTTEAFSQPDARTICGFPKVTFWLLAALIIAIVAAAVAAGVGGSIASSKSRQVQDLQNQLAALRSSSSLSSPSSCSSASGSSSGLPATLIGPVATSVSHVALDCPAIDGKTYHSFAGPVFTTYCAANYENDGPSVNGSGTVKDIAALIAYSINDCMEMCVGYNSGRNNYGSGETCAVVSFVANMSVWLSRYDGNCFLKSLVGPLMNSAAWVASAAIV
jgi:hypothetical protein